MDLDVIQNWQGSRTIVEARAVDGYVIEVRLADGETFVADLSGLVESGNFPEIADPEDFAKVSAVDEGMGIGWYEVRPGLSIHWSDVVSRRKDPESTDDGEG
jgi:hypothetical protein